MAGRHVQYWAVIYLSHGGCEKVAAPYSAHVRSDLQHRAGHSWWWAEARSGWFLQDIPDIPEEKSLG